MPERKLLVFTSRNCDKCSRTLKAAQAAALAHNALPVMEMDISSKTAAELGATQVPEVVLLLDGKELCRRSGALSEADIAAMLDQVG